MNFQYDKDNRGYVMARLEPNMLVQSTNEHWKNRKIRMMQEDTGTGASREPLAVSSMLTSVILMMVGNFLMGQMVLFWSLSWSLPR